MYDVHLTKQVKKTRVIKVVRKSYRVKVMLNNNTLSIVSTYASRVGFEESHNMNKVMQGKRHNNIWIKNCEYIFLGREEHNL